MIKKRKMKKKKMKEKTEKKEKHLRTAKAQHRGRDLLH